jgi:hypothetical protein
LPAPCRLKNTFAKPAGFEDTPAMQRFLIILGIVLILLGALWPLLGKLPLGRLPGDLIITRPNLRIYLPITTSILASILLTLLLWIFRK